MRFPLKICKGARAQGRNGEPYVTRQDELKYVGLWARQRLKERCGHHKGHDKREADRQNPERHHGRFLSRELAGVFFLIVAVLLTSLLVVLLFRTAIHNRTSGGKGAAAQRHSEREKVAC